MTVSPGLIEASELTKRFGDKVAVNHLSFNVEPGRVTGFLGPNGAGKSTTMRLICGLDRANGGTATIGGIPYQDLKRPLLTVGALLEARALHPGRSARNHLLFLAQTQGLPPRRADEVLDLVGLHEVARKRAGGFSLGMTQRLGIAAAMLGDPKVLLLDEPGNGLDPEGIRWVRNLMRQLAGEGRTVFVSSHLMSEMSVTADHLIVIGRGQLIADCATGEFISRSSERSVLVRTPEPGPLRELITGEGGEIKDDDGPDETGTADAVRAFVVTGLPAPRIGELAAHAHVVLHELTPRLPSLEEAFMELTAGSVEYGDSAARQARQPGSPAAAPPEAAAPSSPAAAERSMS
ncbi:MAG TPA: ATP-binding cassette domain-containing protein [Trebonia sp.]|nr:ATP-binding cassette domain-containing protein [Trebonia sp.]